MMLFIMFGLLLHRCRKPLHFSQRLLELGQ